MSRVRLFHEAVGHLVDFDALAALEFALGEALVIQQRALRLLPAPACGAGLFVLDGEDRVQSVNRVGASRFGITVEAMTGHCIWEFMPAEVAGFRQNIVALARARGCRFHYLDNLSDRWLDMFIEPLDCGAVLIRAVDITDAARFRLNGGLVEFVALQCGARTIE